MPNVTGYTTERAETHNRLVDAVRAELAARGYRNRALLPDRHAPDVEIERGPYVEIKTAGRRLTNGPHLTIAARSLLEFRRLEGTEQRHVVIITCWGDKPTDWRVDTPESLSARIVHGPRRRSGSGSATVWYLVDGDRDDRTGDYIAGTPFVDFFPRCNGVGNGVTNGVGNGVTNGVSNGV